MTVVPEVPDGPLDSGAPYWYWLGGRPAVDFVNTLRERWRRRVECLPHAADLAEWLVRAGLLAAPAPVSAETLRQAWSLREAIDQAIVATVAGQPPPVGAIAVIDSWLPRARARSRLEVVSEVAVLHQEGEPDPVLRALGGVALDAARMLGTAERHRLRICAGEGCSARLYDRSPAGRRSWCSMRTCGNVAKARRHRRRRTVALTGGPGLPRSPAAGAAGRRRPADPGPDKAERGGEGR
jgi:predicted RNA-binding Zn ribbon-like protein